MSESHLLRLHFGVYQLSVVIMNKYEHLAVAPRSQQEHHCKNQKVVNNLRMDFEWKPSVLTVLTVLRCISTFSGWISMNIFKYIYNYDAITDYWSTLIWSLTWSMEEKSFCFSALSLRFSNYIVVMYIKSTNFTFFMRHFLYIQALIGRWCKRNGKYKTSLLRLVF